jgi:hypothetical protein
MDEVTVGRPRREMESNTAGIAVEIDPSAAEEWEAGRAWADHVLCWRRAPGFMALQNEVLPRRWSANEEVRELY